MSTFGRWTRTLGGTLAALTLAVALAPAARADEYVDRINKLFATIPPDKRSDTVMLPLLGAMDLAPPILGSQDRAALLSWKGPGWDDCAAWAQKPAQKAVLDAMKKVTEGEDLRTGFAWGQPYGIDGVPVDFVTKGLYTELGDPPMLAGAQHLYMPLLEEMGILAHVESSRLASEGKFDEAIGVMVRWVHFCRQMADRPFVREKHWAMWSMLLGLERIADLAYADFRADKRMLTPEQLKAHIARLRLKDGFLAVERIRIPEGDLSAKEQLVARIMKPRGGADPETFGKTMARIGSVERPLRLFSATAKWDQARMTTAGEMDLSRLVSGLRTDWTKRWELSPFDVLLRQQSTYRTTVRREDRFAVLQSQSFDEFEQLFPLRRSILTQAAGARMSLGVYGFLLAQRTLPPAMSAIRPAFAPATDKDPFSSRGNDILYFVPVRDTPKNADGSDRPHTLRIFPPEPKPSVELQLGADQFVVYSVGPDDNNGRCAEATQGRPGVPGDYLLWPPSLSLIRQYFLDTNQLK